MAAAHKRLEARTAKISRYFTTGWQPDDAPRQPLPEAATLPCLYAAILESLAQVKIRRRGRIGNHRKVETGRQARARDRDA